MKFLFDLFPLIIFFIAFRFYDIYVATMAAIIATLLQVAAFWFKHHSIERQHLINLIIITLFGGLTIFLHDDAFIKWKPTVLNWVFAMTILFMLFTKKTALEYAMGKHITLPKVVWRKFNLSWALFFIFLGFANLYMAFYYNREMPEAIRTQTWVNFKIFGLLGLTIGFVLVQSIFLRKHIAIDEDK